MADPPTVEEIVAVMRIAGDGLHGRRLRGLIVVLWRAGLRIDEALALPEVDLDRRRGSILVRRGKEGRRREIGMDDSPVGTVIALAYPTVACWALLEVGLRVREDVQGKGGRSRDRGTRVLIAISLGVAIGLAAMATSVASLLRTPLGMRVVGVIVMWLGLATRVWAVAALGGAFRTTVEVDPDQAVVTAGPYKWIRHPSYAGLLLILVGFGLALGNWLSVVACLVLPLPALVWRIHVEEAELSRVLGDAYRTYRARTARLIPRLW